MKTETKSLTESPFKSIDEVLRDSFFREHLAGQISSFNKQRALRAEPKPGYHYKRDWHDRMNSLGIFNADFFLKNIASIWMKQSLLCSEMRQVMLTICDNSLKAAILAKLKAAKVEKDVKNNSNKLLVI